MAMAMEKHVNHSANPNRACCVLDVRAYLRDRLKRELASTALQS